MSRQSLTSEQANVLSLVTKVGTNKNSRSCKYPRNTQSPERTGFCTYHFLGLQWHQCHGCLAGSRVTTPDLGDKGPEHDGLSESRKHSDCDHCSDTGRCYSQWCLLDHGADVDWSAQYWRDCDDLVGAVDIEDVVARQWHCRSQGGSTDRNLVLACPVVDDASDLGALTNRPITYIAVQP